MPPTAGCRAFDLFDPQMDLTFPTLVMYPADSPERPERMGPYTLSVSMNAPPAAGSFPLIVISHGTGGSHLVYRTLAEHLARNGFVVAMPEHPRNNRNNNDLAGTAANLENRPRHIRIVLDWAFSSDVFSACLAPGTAAVIGHSLGGYTALAIAGGQPTAFPNETPEHRHRRLEIPSDPRVRALVLLAPATAWYMATGALSEVRVPIAMWTAEQDPHTPSWHGDLVQRGVADPSLVTRTIVPNAGHFAFLSPFPAAMTSPAFPPSQDPPGFDRAQFQESLHPAIVEFLQRALPAGA